MIDSSRNLSDIKPDLLEIRCSNFNWAFTYITMCMKNKLYCISATTILFTICLSLKTFQGNNFNFLEFVFIMAAITPIISWNLFICIKISKLADNNPSNIKNIEVNKIIGQISTETDIRCLQQAIKLAWEFHLSEIEQEKLAHANVNVQHILNRQWFFSPSVAAFTLMGGLLAIFWIFISAISCGVMWVIA